LTLGECDERMKGEEKIKHYHSFKLIGTVPVSSGTAGL
jgi:hypothetical protein